MGTWLLSCHTLTRSPVWSWCNIFLFVDLETVNKYTSRIPLSHFGLLFEHRDLKNELILDVPQKRRLACSIDITPTKNYTVKVRHRDYTCVKLRRRVYTNVKLQHRDYTSVKLLCRVYTDVKLRHRDNTSVKLRVLLILSSFLDIFLRFIVNNKQIALPIDGSIWYGISAYGQCLISSVMNGKFCISVKNKRNINRSFLICIFTEYTVICS